MTLIPGDSNKLPSMGASPITGLAPGDSVALRWDGFPDGVGTAWVGLYGLGQDDRSYLMERFVPLGSWPYYYPLPGDVAVGPYEFRAFRDKGLWRIATTNVVEVGSPAASILACRCLDALGPSGTLEVEWSVNTPNAGDVLDLVLAGTSTSGGVTGSTSTLARGKRTLVIPSGISNGQYEVGFRAGVSGSIIARSQAFYIPTDAAGGARPAGKIYAAFNEVRVNGSTQRFNYTDGSADPYAVVKVCAVGAAEGATPVVTLALPYRAGNPNNTVFVDWPLPTGSVTPGHYEGRLYLAGSALRSFTAPFTLLAP